MITKQKLEELYDSGMTLKQIAAIYGCSYSKLHKIFEQYGIKRRKSGFRKGTKFSDRHRHNISLSKTGSNHPNFGKKCSIHGKRIWVECPNGQVVSMRSRWEVAFAEYLNFIGKQWAYEPTTFNLPDGSAYTPDFLIENEEYVEIKGWMHEVHKNKINLFRRAYPHIRLFVMQRSELLKLGIDLDREFQGAERPKIKCEECGACSLKKSKRQRFCSNACKNRWVANHRGQIERSVEIKRHYAGNQTGEQNNFSKLSEDDAKEIIRLRQEGLTLKSIALLKHTSVGNVGNIIKGRSWKHLEPKNRTRE